MKTRNGFAFGFDPDACAFCAGKCCRGRPGLIRVSSVEIDALAGFLRVNRVDFVTTYLERRNNQLSIREVRMEQESACVFFDQDGNRCAVYPVRPRQCRIFPFWRYYLDRPDCAVAECPGVRLRDENFQPRHG